MRHAISLRRYFLGPSLLLLPILLGGPAARGQGYPLWQANGSALYDQMGHSVAPAGDVNGDGFADVLVGAIHAVNVGPGQALVLSGATGLPLLTFTGTAGPDTHFGKSVAGLGDLTADGVPDLVIGTEKMEAGGVPHVGQARVYSGADGTVVYTFQGVGDYDWLGRSVAAAGDLDADGVPDFLLGRPGADAGGIPGRGEVQLRSGATGTLLLSLLGPEAWAYLGWSCASAGDVDGDGVPDVVAGAPFANPGGLLHAGQAMVFSGTTGLTIHTFSGVVADGRLGWSVAGGGDVDGDGVPDLAVGVPQGEVLGTATGTGSANVFSGADGSTIHTLQGDAVGDRFGFSVGFGGDLDGDGTPELLLGAPAADPSGLLDAGKLLVLAGGSAAPIFELQGAPGDYLGFAAAAAGDMNGDGFPDLIVGASQSFPYPATGAGYARAISPVGIPVGSSIFGAGCAGAGGLPPRISTSGGAPAPGNAQFGVVLSQAPGGSIAALFLGTLPIPAGVPVGGCGVHIGGGILQVGAPLVLAGAPGTAGAGYRILSAPVPALPGLAGATFFLQWAVLDAAGPNGLFTLSDALALTIP
ncbi:MAG: integrin alpha [Planctomycetes bacterium]|nr:integrin alpha [Planctomycetota bacterium]